MNRTCRWPRILPGVALAILLMTVPEAVGSTFESYWHDGKAELNGYDLTVSRYGENRDGSCVMIFVTEPFSEKNRVKVDQVDGWGGDVFEAFKLNMIRDFQTGIYDYNTMVSVFARTDDFSPVKVTFTSAEWCGHVYNEFIFRGNVIENRLHSYFQGESGNRKLKSPSGGIVEDNLFTLLRGLKGDFLKPGEMKKSAYLPGTFFSRLRHVPPDWTTAEITRKKKTENISVPAGSYETIVYELKIAGGREGKFWIEEPYPHRIIRWELDPDVSGELTGTTRLPYWKLHQNGEESYLEELGLVD